MTEWVSEVLRMMSTIFFLFFNKNFRSLPLRSSNFWCLLIASSLSIHDWVLTFKSQHWEISRDVKTRVWVDRATIKSSMKWIGVHVLVPIFWISVRVCVYVCVQTNDWVSTMKCNFPFSKISIEAKAKKEQQLRWIGNKSNQNKIKLHNHL